MSDFTYYEVAYDKKPYADGHPYDGLPCRDCVTCGKRYITSLAARNCCDEITLDDVLGEIERRLVMTRIEI